MSLLDAIAGCTDSKAALRELMLDARPSQR
jgi:hypothetical protein